MIGDALLTVFDGEDATAAQTLTSTDIGLPTGFGVQGGEHMDLMFSADSVLTDATKVDIRWETSDASNFSSVDTVVRQSEDDAKYRSGDLVPLFLRPNRRVKQYNRIVIDFGAQPSAGTVTVAFVKGAEHRTNFPKGYAH
jgi:hypothetical protein